MSKELKNEAREELAAKAAIECHKHCKHYAIFSDCIAKHIDKATKLERERCLEKLEELKKEMQVPSEYLGKLLEFDAEEYNRQMEDDFEATAKSIKDQDNDTQ